MHSPSRTLRYLQCPTLERLERDWAHRVVTTGDVSRVIGAAFAAGCAAYNRAKRDGRAPSSDEIVEAARASLATATVYDKPADTSRTEELRERMGVLTLQGLGKFLIHDPSPQWEVLDVEAEVDDARSRIDLGVRHEGQLAVVDYKVAVRLEERYVSSRRESYRYDWQQLHYCHTYARHKQEPVLRYFIILVALQPSFRIWCDPFDVTPETLDQWVRSAEQTWVDMDATNAGKRARVQNRTACENRYGRCAFWDACWEYGLDTERMMFAYDQRERA